MDVAATKDRNSSRSTRAAPERTAAWLMPANG
jgi:hypothetical protein